MTDMNRHCGSKDSSKHTELEGGGSGWSWLELDEAKTHPRLVVPIR